MTCVDNMGKNMAILRKRKKMISFDATLLPSRLPLGARLPPNAARLVSA